MIPERFTFQWHITDECNLRCKHCYQENYNDIGPDYIKLVHYYNQLEQFALQFKIKNPAFKAHINFTGGEPFLKKEFLAILKLVYERKFFSFAILSNGFLLNDPDLIHLKSLDPKFIQLSLEGGKHLNDQIRGVGSYLQTLKAIKTYRQLKIPVIISFTTNSLNFREIDEVVRISRKYKVQKVWTDRYIPSYKEDKLLMNTNQFRECLMLLQKNKENKWTRILSRTEISASRALQFLTTGGKPYACSAGISLLAIMPNGDIFPCRRLPIVVGNLNSSSLSEIYNKNLDLISLRNLNNINEKCKNCYYVQNCKGGLKCLSYAATGNFHFKDPNCWL